MSKPVSVNVKELPETLRAALASVSYGARDIAIEASEAVSPWVPANDGQRGFVLLVELATGATQAHSGSWGGGSPVVNVVDSDLNAYPIKPGFAVIKGTIGYPRTFATIHLHPGNVAPLLTSHAEVTPREQAILRQFTGLTSAGRKNQWERYPESRPSQLELRALISRGLLSRNRAGAIAITTNGKNAAR